MFTARWNGPHDASQVSWAIEAALLACRRALGTEAAPLRCCNRACGAISQLRGREELKRVELDQRAAPGRGRWRALKATRHAHVGAADAERQVELDFVGDAAAGEVHHLYRLGIGRGVDRQSARVDLVSVSAGIVIAAGVGVGAGVGTRVRAGWG